MDKHVSNVRWGVKPHKNWQIIVRPTYRDVLGLFGLKFGYEGWGEYVDIEYKRKNIILTVISQRKRVSQIYE